MNGRNVVINANDFDRLTELVHSPRFRTSHAPLVMVLEQELGRGRVVSPTGVPKGVVTMNSKVRFRDLRTGRTGDLHAGLPGGGGRRVGQALRAGPAGDRAVRRRTSARWSSAARPAACGGSRSSESSTSRKRPATSTFRRAAVVVARGRGGPCGRRLTNGKGSIMLLCTKVISVRDSERLNAEIDRARSSWLTYAPYLDLFRSELAGRRSCRRPRCRRTRSR